jgi:hypothetical protein
MRLTGAFTTVLRQNVAAKWLARDWCLHHCDAGHGRVGRAGWPHSLMKLMRSSRSPPRTRTMTDTGSIAPAWPFHPRQQTPPATVPHRLLQTTRRRTAPGQGRPRGVTVGSFTRWAYAFSCLEGLHRQAGLVPPHPALARRRFQDDIWDQIRKHPHSKALKPNKQEFVRVHPGAEFREAFPAAARLSLPCQNRLRLPRFLPMTRRSQTATLALAVGG